MQPIKKSLALLILGISLLPALARAATPSPTGERVANGIVTSQYPSVGYLLLLSGNSVGFCSGTLIGCQTFLTAAHCICTDENGVTLNGADCLATPSLLDPVGKMVFLQNAGVFDVASVAVQSRFDFGIRSDVAVLKLSQPVTGVAPSQIDTTGRPPLGTPGTIVGFGLTGGDAFDVGIKRAGQVVTTSCDEASVPSRNQLCWTYKNPIGTPGSNSDTCGGDSGGPLFVDLGHGPVVAGVTSGGSNNCTPDPPDFSFDADVFAESAWIASQAGADLGVACGGLPAAGGPGTTVIAQNGSLGSTVTKKTYTLTVPPLTDRLRVALNTTADFNTDFDLYVKQGTTVGVKNFDCKSTQSLDPDFCEILNPAPGPWSLLVQRASGTGDYQLTSTLYALRTVTPAPCVPSETVMCLTGGRFKVEVSFTTPDGTTGPAHTVPLTENSGYLWFVSANNVEAIVKVLDACSFSGHYWVFAGGLTNVQTTLTVTDTQTGIVRTYFNPQGTAFQPLQDTAAFTCP